MIIFVATLGISLAPYILGVIEPRNYYTILIVLILNFVGLGKSLMSLLLYY